MRLHVRQYPRTCSAPFLHSSASSRRTMSSAAHKNHFSTPAARRETFKYCTNRKIIVDDLVDCGFFLEIDNRSATCFNCGVCFDIEKHTDYKSIHIKLNSNCELLNLSCSTARDRKKSEARVKHLKPVTHYQRQQAPFNEQYLDCHYRLKSLSKSVGNKKKIARAGFYRENKKYVCFQCGVRVRSLKEKDPWKLHCELNPRCSHLVTNRGFFFIANNQ